MYSMTKQHQQDKQIRLKTVQLLKDQSKEKCDVLLCAAKLIHEILSAQYAQLIATQPDKAQATDEKV